MPFRSRLGLYAILVTAVLVFAPVMDNAFVGWDEKELLLGNPAVRTASWDSTRTIFTQSLTGRYYPLSILSYQLDYRFFGLQPAGYHLTNLVLHLLNIVLVFYVLAGLSLRPAVVLGATLLFAVHPLQAESVAWVAARKDVLSAFFFLSAIMAYLKASRQPAGSRGPWMVFSMLLLTLSLLAKPMGMMFPFVLLLIDYYQRRRLTWQDAIAKIPFALICLTVVLVTLRMVDRAGAFSLSGSFTFMERALFSGYSFCLYLGKIIFPHPLACLYPFPSVRDAWALGLLWACTAASAAGVYGMIKYNQRLHQSGLAFLFFAVMIFPLLHVAKLNTSPIYDRFVYVPAIGIFIFLSAGFDRLRETMAKGQWPRRLVLAATAGYVLWLAFSTWSRCGVWKNSDALWADAVSTFPDFSFAHLQRGGAYAERGANQEAFMSYNRAIELNPGQGMAYFGRARMYEIQKKYDLAIADYTRSLHLDANVPGAALKEYRARTYLNRGVMYAFKGQYARAIDDYDEAWRFEPENLLIRINRAMAYYKLQQPERAMADISFVLARSPTHPFALYMKKMLEGPPSTESGPRP